MKEKDISELEMNIEDDAQDVQKENDMESSLDDTPENCGTLNLKEQDELQEKAEEMTEDNKIHTNDNADITDISDNVVTGESVSDENFNKSDEMQKIIDDLNRQIEELKNQNNSYLDSLQRLMAEFENYKKRTAREKEAIYKNACADVISEFLPVIDNMEMAAKSMNDTGNNIESIKQGVDMVFKQLMDVFTQLGVEEIPALEQKFDPELHEAVMHIEDEKYDENVIVEVFKKGYRLKDKVLRHSVVKVAN